MSDTSSLKKKVVIKKDSKIWLVQEVFFVNPGKGAAFYRTKLKEIPTGKVVENTFKSGENIELVDIERRNATFLYQNGDQYVFMDQENYEQYEFTSSLIGSLAQYLKENQDVIILFVENTPVHLSFPKPKVSFLVTNAPPAIKGDTVSSSYRGVTIETGALIQVPLFVNQGDRIIVNTETGEYCERDKK